MARRTVALCNGKQIGIEIIYTVVNGRQINIPDMLRYLREKSQKNELFCPCGCGTNLVLVAGDKNLREQHFREKSGTGELACTIPSEGEISVASKIVLKCWLDDKLKAVDIESRVPIDALEDTKRKTEFTFLSREKKFAIRYWRTRSNIMNDKLDNLTDNLSKIKVLFIVDLSNGGTNGQYPEALMKLQEKQRFCLLLEANEGEYNKAYLKAVVYEKDLDGLWKEVVIAEGKLNEFGIENHRLIFAGNTIEQLLEVAKETFFIEQQVKKERKVEEEKLRVERKQSYLEELEIFKLEMEYQYKNFEEQQRLEVVRKQFERILREEDFKRNLETNFEQQETQVVDVDGNRWIKCEFCDKIATVDSFFTYGGVNHINLGTCKECFNNNPSVKEKSEQKLSVVTKKIDPTVCPDCGGKLKERSGPYSKFYGCINFPKCRFTRSIS